MSKSKKQIDKPINFVHKFMDEFNTAKTFTDRKKEFKNGKIKHKGRGYDTSF